MAMHNKKALSGLVLFKTIQNNAEKQKKKENIWRRESWMRNGLVGPGRGVVGPRLSGLVQLPNQTSRDYSGLSGLLRGIFVPPCPTSKIFTSPEWGKGQRKSLWTPHTHHSLRTVGFWSVLQSTDHQKSQAQEQFNAGYFQPEQL